MRKNWLFGDIYFYLTSHRFTSTHIQVNKILLFGIRSSAKLTSNTFLLLTRRNTPRKPGLPKPERLSATTFGMVAMALARQRERHYTIIEMQCICLCVQRGVCAAWVE